MNNLVVLYGIEGRTVEREYWELRVAQYRDANPYYHAWLGDEAAEALEWQQALRNYERALALSPGDSSLLSALGHSHEQLGETGIASGYIRRAIEAAPTRAESATYRMQLNAMQRKQRPAPKRRSEYRPGAPFFP